LLPVKFSGGMNLLLNDLRFTSAAMVSNAATRLFATMNDPVALIDTHVPGVDSPFAIADSIRARGPLVKSKLGIYVSANYDVCRDLLRSPLLGSKSVSPPSRLARILDTQSIGAEDHPINQTFIGMDPPDHTRLRRLVSLAFTPKSIAAHRARIETNAHTLLDECAEKSPVDLISSYAAPIPMAVICDLLGLPSSERARFFAWGESMIAALDRVRSLRGAREIMRTNAELRSYLFAVVAERRRNPTDDVVSALVEAADQGDRLTDDEIVSTLTLLLIAGFETTVNLIGTGTSNLLQRPDQRGLVMGDPDVHIPGLIEESLRFEGPVQFTFRVAQQQDIDIKGDTLPMGESIVLCLAGASRDPAKFTDPNTFDITRSNARDHLAFSGGAHYCLGAALARLEAEVAWKVLFERAPNLRAAGLPVYRPSPTVRGLASLPVRLT
jgi:cytochrome P450